MASTKWKAPENFVSMASTFYRVDEDRESAESETDASELWLVQVPQGFDVSSLNKLDSSVLAMTGTTQTLKVKTEQGKKNYSVAAFRDSPDCQAVNTVVTDASGQTVLGREVSHMLVVTEMTAPGVWQADTTLLAPKQPVPMPTGLRARYTPFGAGTPCPSVSSKLKKSKKRSSRGVESMEEEVIQDTKTSSKKRKREPQEEKDVTDAHQDSKRRKHETDHNTCDESTPTKKKKKKSKHKDSETMDVHNGDGNKSASALEYSAALAGEIDTSLSFSQSPTSSGKKKKKSKHSHSEPVCNGEGDNSLSVTMSPEVSAEVTDHHAASFTTPQSPKKKKKKSRKSEGAVEQWNSADGGNLFVLDTCGDRTHLEKEDLTMPDEHSLSKHKKSKKKEKHSQCNLPRL